jgi:hypothetical protein
MLEENIQNEGMKEIPKEPSTEKQVEIINQ